MKKEELFEGAIVLARSSCERRSRWKVLEVGDSLVKIKKDNLTMYTGIRHLRPAKITRKALKEIGFVERESVCPRRLKPLCHEFVYPLEYPWSRETRIVLKDECNEWGPTRMFGGLGVHKVQYIHEVQKIISNQQL